MRVGAVVLLSAQQDAGLFEALEAHMGAVAAAARAALSARRGALDASVVDACVFLGQRMVGEVADARAVKKEQFLTYIEAFSEIAVWGERPVREASFRVLCGALRLHKEDTLTEYIERAIDARNAGGTSEAGELECSAYGRAGRRVVALRVLKGEIERRGEDEEFMRWAQAFVAEKVFRAGAAEALVEIEAFMEETEFAMQALNLYIFLQRGNKVGIGRVVIGEEGNGADGDAAEGEKGEHREGEEEVDCPTEGRSAAMDGAAGAVGGRGIGG
ncbi:uncharacterized protein T551_02038 [Pneumocystis jirovecii RU7]|uniref:Uncharacterized protein n=1 Tax=Pneumocystis jirovecii (strain RU7) TaxID=1408657 RepID=A0A0W4ZNZ8_PNEJ7|nr:uncharacterized protein T551_02038 [Pneumocystis jirovecii RU7]KTW30094.1 hypothetical protein T551_02038 [Pneumocystis jirovecii RU7]